MSHLEHGALGPHDTHATLSATEDEHVVPTHPSRLHRVYRLVDLLRTDWDGGKYVCFGVVVLLVTSLVVIAFYVNHPKVETDPDTIGYLNAAQRILHHGWFVDKIRPPGYPSLIALVYAIAGDGNLAAVSAVQGALFVVATMELYALVCLVLRRGWIALIIGLLSGTNIQMLSWVKPVIVEGTALWLTVSLALAVVMFIRAARPICFWLVVICMLTLFMTRPEWILLPIPLFAYLLFIARRRGQAKRLLKHILAGVVVLYAVFGAYIYINGTQNGYWGISNTQNFDMFGKVIQYRMQGDASPADASITAAVQSYVNRGGYDLFEVMAEHPEFTYSRVGQYGSSIIVHHLPEFVLKSIPVILTSSNYYWEWSTVVPSAYFGRYLTTLDTLSADVYRTYRYFPLLLLAWVALLVWPRTSRLQVVELMAAISFITIYELGLAVAGCYALPAPNNQGWIDYARIHLPICPLIIEVNVGSLLAAAVFLIGPRGLAWGFGVLDRRFHESKQTSPGPYQTMAYPGPARAQAPASDAAAPTPQALESAVPDSLAESVEISIVMPCLNEEQAIGACIDSVKQVIAAHHLNAEILVVDNASTDRSAEVALAHGARVVYQPQRGYGNAYLMGFAVARGTYIVMADADGTYDFSEIPAFVEPLRQGYDLVMGNRFSGRMARGAMTWSHRYLGNPLLSGMLNAFFHTGVRDAHCGMRAFIKDAAERMRLRTGGMEFASEMVINAAKARLKIAERPIIYRPRIGASKLHTLRDGWRHLRFMLLYSPTHLFLIPGAIVMALGLFVVSALLSGPVLLFGHRWDVHTMILASVVALIGFQVISLGLTARFFSLTEELDGEQDRVLRWLNRVFTLERGLLLGAAIFAVGFTVDAAILVKWIRESMGPLNEVRPAIFATTLIAIGTQIIFGSFFLSFLQFRVSIHATSLAVVRSEDDGRAVVGPADT